MQARYACRNQMTTLLVILHAWTQHAKRAAADKTKRAYLGTTSFLLRFDIGTMSAVVRRRVVGD